MTHQYEEKTLHSQTLFEGKVFRLEVAEVLLPNGKKSTREMIKHPGAVAILAMMDDGKLILVDQYRKVAEQGLLELPAGKLEKGEQPLASAIRELEEETGLKADTIEPLYAFYTAPGFTDEIIHLFLANGLRRIENPADTDEDEFLDLLEVSLAEALEMVRNGRIQDAKTIIAIQHYALIQS